MEAANTWVFAVVLALLSVWHGVVGPLTMVLVISYTVTWLVYFASNRIIGSRVAKHAAVLVTGSSSGIGRATVVQLVDSGFLVFAGVRKPADGESLKRQASQAELVHPVLIDVTDEESVAAAVKEVENHLQHSNRHLAGVVNNAGYAEYGALETLSEQRWRKQLEVNVVGHALVTRAFAPLLRKAKAAAGRFHSPRIVFISSAGGRLTSAGAAAYCASKHAVEALGDGFRMELAHFGIHVAIVQPGAIAGTKFKSNMALDPGHKQDSSSLPALESNVLKHYTSACEQAFAVELPSSPVKGVASVVERALREAFPLSRYLAGLDAALLPLLGLLPDVFMDRVLTHSSFR